MGAIGVQNNTKGAEKLNHYATNRSVSYLQSAIIKLTSAMALMLSKQRNRLLIHKQGGLRLLT